MKFLLIHQFRKEFLLNENEMHFRDFPHLYYFVCVCIFMQHKEMFRHELCVAMYFLVFLSLAVVLCILSASLLLLNPDKE